MAKFSPQRKTQNNFFTKSIQKYGEDFLSKMNAKEMQNGAISLFRDIAKGRVDLGKYGHYFLINQFVDNCLVEAYAKLAYHSTNFTALNWFIAQNQANIQDLETNLQVLESDRRSTQAYECIITNLQALKFSQDLNYLYVMSNNLRYLRNNI